MLRVFKVIPGQLFTPLQRPKYLLLNDELDMPMHLHLLAG